MYGAVASGRGNQFIHLFSHCPFILLSSLVFILPPRTFKEDEKGGGNNSDEHLSLRSVLLHASWGSENNQVTKWTIWLQIVTGLLRSNKAVRGSIGDREGCMGYLGRAAEKGLSEELIFEQRRKWHDVQNLMEKVPGRGLSKYKDPDRRKSLSWNSDAWESCRSRGIPEVGNLGCIMELFL